MSASQFSRYPQASIEELKTGTRVLHRIFGEGHIEEVKEVDSDDPSKAKLTVRFKGFELPKKLVFRHAKLAIPSA
jgi:hypothetical protein